MPYPHEAQDALTLLRATLGRLTAHRTDMEAVIEALRKDIDTLDSVLTLLALAEVEEEREGPYEIQILLETVGDIVNAFNELGGELERVEEIADRLAVEVVG